MGISETSNFQ
jgi:hypothetical protein